MKRIFCFILLASVAMQTLSAQDTTKVDKKKDIIKKGISFAPFPIVGFDENKGFQLGALCNIYNFGNGDWYPNPKAQWYAEASFFTKGSMLFVLNYDNKTLIPGVRMCVGATFNRDKALDFYGFNGYEQAIDRSLPSTYYKTSRQVPCFKADFTGKIWNNLYWKAGYQFKWFDTGIFEKDGENVPTLFENYINTGIIDESQVGSGITSSIRAGIMYDSRNFEAEPTSGIWAEADLEGAPGWLGTSVPYVKYYLCLRHYIPLVKEKLTFALRLNWQGFFQDPAYYVLPFESQFGVGYDRDGFGGYRTIRGLVLDRIQGRSVVYFNTELRYHFVDFHLFRQNFGIAVNGFCDGGRVVVPYGKRKADATEHMHITSGGGIRIIVNRNFVVAAEYGIPFNDQDSPVGKRGSFYINTGFIF